MFPILRIIFEKLLKNKISDTLQQNISKFQNGDREMFQWWLEDCINSSWDLDVKDDILCLIYLMNINITIKTPLGDTDSLFLSNFVKQGTVLGPVFNNC